MVRLRDIAEAASVSQTTVSKVLNEKHLEIGITPACAARVLAVAERLGYRPNRAARATASGRFNMIALLEVGDRIGIGQLPQGLLNGIEAQCRELGLLTAFSALHPDRANPSQIPAFLRESWADGFLVFGENDEATRLAEFIRQLRPPMIRVGIQDEADCIYPNEADAARQATEHALNAGHQRIVYIQDAWKSTSVRQARHAGYETVMQGAGLRPETLELPGEYRRVEAHPWKERTQIRQAFLRDTARPTALLVDSVEIAYPLLHEAHGLGLRLPEELSMITFHDVVANALGPSISTMLIPCGEWGRSSVKLLQQRIESGKPLPPVALAYKYVGGDTL